MTSKENFIGKFLTALSWSDSDDEQPINAATHTFWDRLLTALTFAQVVAISRPYEGKTQDIAELWETVHQKMNQNRPLRAERALLTILKIDEKNASAYNNLGVLYAKQKEYLDSIECFEIANSIETNASTLHNLGLVHFELGNYEDSAKALREALVLQDDLAARHVAYAKALEKLGNTKSMLESLEKAVQLERNVETLSLLYESYSMLGMQIEAKVIQNELAEMLVPINKTSKILRSFKSRIPELYIAND